jgi:phosphatidylserine/phosphatidylglycerophosphate/cardiolipin synthase-like enzyme
MAGYKEAGREDAMDIDPGTWDRMLEQTLDDGRLSNSERSALKERIRDAALDDRNRALLRSRAFELARRKLGESRSPELLSWLEDVTKLLLPFSGESGEPFVEAHFSPGEACCRRIMGLLRGARRQAELCVYTITDDRITGEVLAAHRRGVAVRLVTDNEKAYDPGSDTLQLARAGVPVKVDDSPYFMHHKFAIFDGDTLLTGSYNWTRGAADNNEENLILSNDRRLLTAFRGEFERLWAKFDPPRMGS